MDSGLELGPKLAVLPDWSHVEVAVEDRQLSLEVGRMLEHRRLLDTHLGILWREWRQQDLSGRLTRLIYRIVVAPTAALMRVSEIEVAIASATELRGSAESITSIPEVNCRSSEQRWVWQASLGQTVRLDRVVCVFTSRDVASPAKAAGGHLATIRIAFSFFDVFGFFLRCLS
jgi:trehalose/maltose hydrolase-like predicted phosphorylase